MRINHTIFYLIAKSINIIPFYTHILPESLNRISSHIVLRFVSYQSLKFFEFLIIRSVMFFLSLWSWYVSGELR